MALAAVCGMGTESTIWNSSDRAVLIQGRDADTKIASDLEALIAKGGVDGIMSFGVCGALAPDLQAGDIVVGSLIIGPDGHVLPNVAWREDVADALAGVGFSHRWRRGVFCYSTGVVANANAKAALRAVTQADVVDMETWPAAQVAARHDLPFMALRTVSDPYNFDMPPAALAALASSGNIDFGAVIESLAGDIGQIGQLLLLEGYSGMSFDNLAAAKLQIGENFCFPGVVT